MGAGGFLDPPRPKVLESRCQRQDLWPQRWLVLWLLVGWHLCHLHRFRMVVPPAIRGLLHRSVSAARCFTGGLLGSLGGVGDGAWRRRHDINVLLGSRGPPHDVGGRNAMGLTAIDRQNLDDGAAAREERAGSRDDWATGRTWSPEGRPGAWRSASVAKPTLRNLNFSNLGRKRRLGGILEQHLCCVPR